MTFELFYWPGLQGRGEFVRLAFEATGTPYVEIVRGDGPGQGLDALLHAMDDPACIDPPYAPPFLRVGDALIGQPANILAYPGPLLGPVGEAARARRWVNCSSRWRISWPKSTTVTTRSPAGFTTAISAPRRASAPPT